jgi:hypothetical protein
MAQRMNRTPAVPPASSVTVVDGQNVEWINGREAFATMTPAFRDNLGDPARVQELLSKYWLRPLWVDPDSTRRIDHVRTDPGYQDLSEAYHDSVEEALFLGGSVDLTAEGHLQAGDYFWRPPGWVHSAGSVDGFECLLMMEGEDAAEGSGRVSRVVRDDDEAGRFAHPGPDDAGVGPRGYVRRLETRLLPPEQLDDAQTRLLESGAAPLTGRVLSRNVRTLSASVLVDIPTGWSSAVPAADRERFLVVVDGALTVDAHELTPCSLIRIAPGSPGPQLAAEGGCRLLVKVGSPR